MIDTNAWNQVAEHSAGYPLLLFISETFSEIQRSIIKLFLDLQHTPNVEHCFFFEFYVKNIFKIKSNLAVKFANFKRKSKIRISVGMNFVKLNQWINNI